LRAHFSATENLVDRVAAPKAIHAGLWREQHPEVPLQLQLWIAPSGASFLSGAEDGTKRAA
jgi:hypothetical protein